MKSLTDLANEYHTDKGTTFRQGHGYTTVYETLFEPFRHQPIRLLEVGLSIGGPELEYGSVNRTIVDAPSIRMWHTYFPVAHVHGLDISDFSQFQTDWFTFHRADCGDSAQLDAAVTSLGERMDIIIDDGSHASFHQQLTLCKLLPLLKPRGLYVIEDLNWQPTAYEQGRSLPRVIRTDRLLAHFIETGAFPRMKNDLYESLAAIANQIAHIFLFDEDYLFNLRRCHNLRMNLTPDRASYVDAKRAKRFLKRGYARRVLEDGVLFLQTIMGHVTPLRRPRTKLAVIQRK